MPTLYVKEECILPEAGELENPGGKDTLILAAAREKRQSGRK